MSVAWFAALATAVLLPYWPEESKFAVAPPVMVKRRLIETEGVCVVWYTLALAPVYWMPPVVPLVKTMLAWFWATLAPTPAPKPPLPMLLGWPMSASLVAAMRPPVKFSAPVKVLRPVSVRVPVLALFTAIAAVAPSWMMPVKMPAPALLPSVIVAVPLAAPLVMVPAPLSEFRFSVAVPETGAEAIFTPFRSSVVF